MLSHDLRLTIRHLWKRKLYTLIILISLALGFACTILLTTLLIWETNTDHFHKNIERSVQVFTDDPFTSNGTLPYVPTYLPEYLGKFPEVQKVMQVGTIGNVSLHTMNGEFHDIQLLSVDSSFFEIFSFPITTGSDRGGLAPDCIVLSEEKAKNLFGRSEVIGQLVTLKTQDTTRLLRVSAVIGKAPENSHLVFDGLVEHAVLQNNFQGGASYLLLANAAQCSGLVKKINADPQRPGIMGIGKATYSMEPLSESYFNSSNKMTFMVTRNPLFIKVGIIASGLILFMASFNFISLFLLSLQSRIKEGCLKKMFGISWWSMIRAAAIEVILYVAMAHALAVAFLSFALDKFNLIAESNLTFDYVSRPEVLLWNAFAVLSIGITVVFLTMRRQRRIKLVSVIKNSGASKVSFNKTLFTVQFVVSIVLVICGVTTIRQMEFVKNEPLGFNRNILRLQSPGKPYDQHLATLKQELLKISGVQHASVVSGNPISGNWMARYELEDGRSFTPFLFDGDEDMFSTLGLTLIEGELPSRSRSGKVVNETLVKEFGLKHPVGEKIPGTEDMIIGVVKDFTCTSFKDRIQPAILSYSENNSRLIIDYDGQSIGSLLPLIELAWKKIYPDHPFSYVVIQEELMKKYKDEKFFYKTVVTFALTTVLISCFGLFALSWAVAESRIKEIGIRKVLGASVTDIAGLLTKSFLSRVVIAFLIAGPLGYYLMSQWLSLFAKRIDLDISVFATSGIAVIAIAVLTMSIQTIRASRTNPVDELRRAD